MGQMPLGAIAQGLGVIILTLVAMEAITTLAHRHLMHGIGWVWHRSHHLGQPGWQRNDRFGLVVAAFTIGLFALAPTRTHWSYFLAIGITLYGLLYFLLHDGLVHRRLPFRLAPRGRYLRRLVRAHHLHHAVRTREGAVSFGFLYAPPISVLQARRRRGQI